MTVPSTIADLYQRVVLCMDFETIYSTGGVTYLKDMGPNGFDFAFPGGAANPTVVGDGSLSFDGGDYLVCPAAQLARFYAKMPTREHVWLFVGSRAATTTMIPFSAWNATNTGVYIQMSAVPWSITGFGIGASTSSIYTPVGSWAASKRIAHVVSVATTPTAMLDTAIVVAAWAAGAFGTVVYDPALVPRISGWSGGQNWLGSMSYLCLLDTNGWSLDYATMSTLSKLMRSGAKPWCTRSM